MSDNDKDKFEEIEHQLWHLVEDVKELSKEMNTFSRLFFHVHEDKITYCMAQMYKLTCEMKQQHHDKIEKLDRDLLLNKIRDLLERFGKLRDDE